LPLKRRLMMDTISRKELKEKLEGQEDLKLVMVLGDWAYRAKHIPGSLHLDTLEEASEALEPGDEIVVYDSNPSCVASLQAYKILKYHGYERVRRYVGGLEDWEEAGYPLNGEFFGGRSRPEDVGLDASRTTCGSDQR
jgi:rhodanese-related sulfurtransferase